MISPEDYIGGYIEKIDLEEAEDLVKHCIEQKFEYIQIGHIKNGLGPKAIFNFYQLKVRKDDYLPPDKFEISNETMKYLKDKYSEIKLYI